jgi:hypothetical protein
MAPPEHPPPPRRYPPTALGFTLPVEEARRIRQAAERQQLTLSQFLRQAARRALDDDAEAP